MVCLHTSCAESVEHDGPAILLKLRIDEIAASLDPVVVSDRLASAHLCEPILGHVDGDGFEPVAGQRSAQNRGHLPAICPHAVKEDDFQRRIGVSVTIEVNLVLPPGPPLLFRFLPWAQLEAFGQELLDLAPVGLLGIRVRPSCMSLHTFPGKLSLNPNGWLKVRSLAGN